MEQMLKDYGRYLLLEEQRPRLEEEKEVRRREALAAERALSQKRLEWRQLEKPGFFRRLLGNLQEKQDRAYQEYQAAEAAMAQAKRAAEASSASLESVKAELEALKGIPDRYLQAKENGDLQNLGDKLLEAFAPAALVYCERCLVALEEAREVSRDLVAVVPKNQEEEKLDHFAAARQAAKPLLWILEQFPEPEGWTCGYLKNPDGFLLMAATKYSRRDRLNEAVGQMTALRRRLRERR